MILEKKILKFITCLLCLLVFNNNICLLSDPIIHTKLYDVKRNFFVISVMKL